MLLDADYTARLADFGFASLVGNIPEALTYLQRSTAWPGALRWIAPEQVDPEETFNRTSKTDIYSFGCVALQGCSFTGSDPGPLLIPLQVLSGKQPWSEVRRDSTVMLHLAKREKPGQPESRTLNDLHWNLIQDCWSEIEECPAADVIISTIKQFLSHCPQSPPLCDLLPAGSSEADPGARLSPSVSQATERSGTRMTQAASDGDDQNRYGVMIISVHLITLILAYTSIRIGSLSDVSSLDRPHEREKRRMSLTGNQSTAEMNEQSHHKRWHV